MVHHLLNSPLKQRPTMATCSSLLCLLLVVCLPHISAMSPFMLADDSSSYVKCGECDESRCPVLSYCEGKAIKDSCNCCTICSSPKYQPHETVSVIGGDECEKVKCPGFQVCVANMQGLPLCKCPSEFICRKHRKRNICGTDGVTYQSTCHMRISRCKQGMIVRKKHRGVCTAEDERDGEAFKRKMRRRLRRRRRRQKLEEATATAGVGGSDIATKGENGGDGGGGGADGVAMTSFGKGSDVFGTGDQGGLIGQGGDKAGTQSSKGSKRRDKKAKLKRRRRRKKNRKQRKQRKGTKRDKSERRRRRRKRQHGKPRSRSKRHRNTRNFDDAETRERMFEQQFGHNTWFA